MYSADPAENVEKKRSFGTDVYNCYTECRRFHVVQLLTFTITVLEQNNTVTAPRSTATASFYIASTNRCKALLLPKQLISSVNIVKFTVTVLNRKCRYLMPCYGIDQRYERYRKNEGVNT